MTYIYEQPGWPNFVWDGALLSDRLAGARFRQGQLLGRMQALGFSRREEASLLTLTEEVVKSSDIEGETLDRQQVRSSIARRLGLDIGALAPADRHVDGIVDMMLDATREHGAPLTAERLFGWHAALFPTGRSGLSRITTGAWRTAQSGPMQVVSGPPDRERIHYQAPHADRLQQDMQHFLTWFNAADGVDPVLKAALAHFWFVTIHPFEDGNGRIARAIADLALTRSDGSPQRFYSMSAQIRRERSAYYDILENSQKGGLDITRWLDWFLGCLDRALDGSEHILANVLSKARFWERHAGTALTDRQRAVLDRLLEGFEGKLTSSKWAKLTKVSQATAARDIEDLIARGILIKDASGGRSTSYSLREAEAGLSDANFSAKTAPLAIQKL